jgi:hypothetical protein
MKRTAAILFAGLLAFAPALAIAQDYPMDSQHPKEYTDEDSQPLKLASYVLAPVGFVLEWTVARPLHYLANESPLAPMLGANTESEGLSPPNVKPLPPPDVITESSEHIETTIVPAPESAQGYQTKPPSGKAAAAVTPPASTQQPVLH